MANKWSERYLYYRLKVGKYLEVLVNWDYAKGDDPSGYHMSISFNPVKYKTIMENRDDAQKQILLRAKSIIEQMLVDINQVIEEEAKEQ